MATNTESQINIDIKSTDLESAVVIAPFNQAKRTLEERGYRVISARDNAFLRIQQGRDHRVSKNGNWTREGFLYLPKREVYLTKNSPIMDNPEQATEANRRGDWFCLTDEQIDKARSNSCLITRKKIPTDRFGEEEMTRFLFEDQAEAYGNFLRDNNLKNMAIWLANTESKPFATQPWFDDLGRWSGLVGGYGLLGCYGALRGVKNITGEASSRNF